MKRRTALFGLGLLASGSGAIATSAAITGTVETTAGINVVVETDLEVKAGAAFNDDGSVRSSNKYDNQYVPYTSNSSFFQDQSNPLDDINREDAPVATVSPRNTTSNEDLELRVALSIENNTDRFTFKDILQVENNGGQEQHVGIRYDRENTDYDPNGQYGRDVIVPGSYQNELSQHDVQHIYRFTAKDLNNGGNTRISPNPTTDSDEPTESRIVGPGETMQLDLEIRLDMLDEFVVSLDPKEHIRGAIDTTGGFGDSITTVDLLDGITIENSSYA